MATVLGVAPARAAESAAVAAARAAPPQFSCRILLAEDNAVNQRVAVRLLEKQGCQVDVAANGREAVEMIEKFSYHLVFMDCQMPEMDGYEATAAIREAEAVRGLHTPIIAMTANAMQGDRERCLDAGMDDYLSKPIQIEGLQRALGCWVREPAPV